MFDAIGTLFSWLLAAWGWIVAGLVIFGIIANVFFNERVGQWPTQEPGDPDPEDLGW